MDYRFFPLKHFRKTLKTVETSAEVDLSPAIHAIAKIAKRYGYLESILDSQELEDWEREQVQTEIAEMRIALAEIHESFDAKQVTKNLTIYPV